jgi:Na/Pi-cotransporter
MKHLLNLLAAIALLVWGTHLVRTGILRVFGANLRNVLAHSVGNRWTAAISGLGVTALVQSSTATALIVASFVGQGLITLPLALAVMLGADIGTSLVTVVFSFALACILGGAVGNVVDRLMHGYVVDFLQVHWDNRWYFPAFNLADAAITIGAACLILDELLRVRRSR